MSHEPQPRIVRLEARIRRLERMLGISADFPTLQDLEHDEDGPTLRLVQVSEVIGLTMTQLRAMIEDNALKGSRQGRNYFVTWRDLRAYLFGSGVLPLRKGR